LRKEVQKGKRRDNDVFVVTTDVSWDAINELQFIAFWLRGDWLSPEEYEKLEADPSWVRRD
jgi:hypothetical protein